MLVRKLPILTASVLTGLALCAPAALAQSPPATSAAGRIAAKVETTRSDEEQAVIRRHFKICDLNGNGWISFREASATLGIPKSEFRRYDANSDGRFTESEFGQEKQRMLQLLGALKRSATGNDSSASARNGTSFDSRNAPSTSGLDGGSDASSNPWELSAAASSMKSGKSVLPSALALLDSPRHRFPDPKELLAFFDRDESAGLSPEEVKRVLRRVRAPLSAEVILEHTDRDATGQLELIELGPLATMISSRWAAAGLPRPGSGATALGPQAFRLSSVNESADSDSTPTPAEQSSAPQQEEHLSRASFDHFSQLDADGDNRIDAKDLRMRLAPARASIRTSSIISALDLDGDGALDETEFHAALRGN